MDRASFWVEFEARDIKQQKLLARPFPYAGDRESRFFWLALVEKTPEAVISLKKDFAERFETLSDAERVGNTSIGLENEVQPVEVVAIATSALFGRRF